MQFLSVISKCNTSIRVNTEMAICKKKIKIKKFIFVLFETIQGTNLPYYL